MPWSEQHSGELPRLLLGMQSGTSADGVDLALVRVSGRGAAREAEVLNGARAPMPAALQQRARASSAWTLAQFAEADQAFGEHFGRCASDFLRSLNVAAETLAAIGSHGQTVFHHDGNPREGSVQIGAAARIARATGVAVVNDFRAADLAAGGQGAPISPFADWVLHRSAAPSLVVLNLGGIANLTLLRGDAPPAAGDCGPANGPLDALTQQEAGTAYDLDGRLAASGQVLPELAAELRADPFFSRPWPRSTGVERFGPGLARSLRARLPKARLEDLLASLVDLAAHGVASALGALEVGSQVPVYLCGGGAENPTLCRAIGQAIGPGRLRRYAELAPPGDLRGDGGLREAVAFALLADAFLAREATCWPSTTGCEAPSVLGALTPAPPRPADRGSDPSERPLLS
ncbi:MAG: anhydro-N-acetylmuramic acid kinase [Planctomycetota bacterium]|nr:anhydro-N-acetylmuramic acid kinase [Planctomycetota bacterium]